MGKLFSLLLLFYFSAFGPTVKQVWADEGEPIEDAVPNQKNLETNPVFAIESGVAGLSLFSSPSTLGGMLHVKGLYPLPTPTNPWVYFADYSVSVGSNYFGNVEYIHFLNLGTRFYGDWGAGLHPYAMFSLGLMAQGVNLNSLQVLPLPLPSAGIGLDYMFLPNMGINAEVSALLVSWQFKLGLKFLI